MGLIEYMAIRSLRSKTNIRSTVTTENVQLNGPYFERSQAKMIEPISLKMHGDSIVITEALRCTTDTVGDKYTVEVMTIDSGRLKGQVVAYVRYLLDDRDYPWQVIKQRSPNRYMHYSTVKTLEQALHLVMACAYEYVAFN